MTAGFEPWTTRSHADRANPHSPRIDSEDHKFRIRVAPVNSQFRQTSQNLHFNEVLGQDRDLGLQRVDLVLGSEGVDEDEPVDELMTAGQSILEGLAGEEVREATHLR